MLAVFDSNNFLLRNAPGGKSFTSADGRQLQTSTGILTGPLLGALNAFVRLYRVHKFNACVFTFDSGKSSFRTAIRGSYKANRGPVTMTDEMQDQFGYFTEFLDVMGIPHLRSTGVEADDLIAAVVAKAKPHPTMIFSADHDLLQLASRTVSVCRLDKDARVLSADTIEDTYGLPPRLLPLVWALQGDTGDNIEGIPKVGPVTATKIVKSCLDADGRMDVEAYWENEKVRPYKDLVAENIRLIRLKAQPFLHLVPDDLPINFQPTYSEALRDYLERFEFKAMLSRFDTETLWQTTRFICGSSAPRGTQIDVKEKLK